MEAAFQGRIEGNVKKLCARAGRKRAKSSPSSPPAPIAIKRRRYLGLVDDDEDVDDGRRSVGGDEGSIKRGLARKLLEDFDRVAAESGLGKKRGSPVKNSGGGSEAVASRTRSRRSDGAETVKKEQVGKIYSKGTKKLIKNGKAVRRENDHSPPVGGTRTSPRLVKQSSG